MAEITMSKHSKELWRDKAKPWEMYVNDGDITIRTANGTIVDVPRIVACIDALADVEDPAKFMEELKTMNPEVKSFIEDLRNPNLDLFMKERKYMADRMEKLFREGRVTTMCYAKLDELEIPVPSKYAGAIERCVRERDEAREALKRIAEGAFRENKEANTLRWIAIEALQTNRST